MEYPTEWFEQEYEYKHSRRIPESERPVCRKTGIVIQDGMRVKRFTIKPDKWSYSTAFEIVEEQ